MNILLVTSPVVSLREPFCGGTEAFVVNFANALACNGHEVDVLCRDADEDNGFNVVQLQESEMRMKDNATSEEQGQKLHQSVQFALVDTQKYDIVHYHSYLPSLYEYGSLHNRKNIVTLHSPVSQRLSVAHALHRERSNDIYVAVSERLKNEWAKCIGNNIRTIANGIDISNYGSVCEPPFPETYLFWCGRICPEKDLVSAINLASAQGLHLLFAGPVSDKGYYENQIKPLLSSNTIHLGHLTQDELFPYLTHAYALLATSAWSEPFGLMTLEALASGTPVVGYKTAIPPELRHPPMTNIISKSDVRAFAEALNTIGLKTTENCKRFAGTFSLSQTVKQYEDLYEQIYI